MWTKLDERLFKMIELVPEWPEVLGPDDTALVQQRGHGATFKDLACSFGVSVPTVRARLYGMGVGGKRHGGALGRLRGRHLRNTRRGTAIDNMETSAI